MKDNKLTDKEIIEALEGWMMCLFAASEHFNLQMNREENLLQSAIDLIKRQQETIETLRGCIERHHIIRKDGKSPLSLLTAEIRAEAIKEFAERLQEKADDIGIDEDGFLFTISAEWETWFRVGDWCEEIIDNLVKEKAGD